MFSMLYTEHARVVPERLQIQHGDPFEIGMIRVYETVVLAESNDRGHKQQAMLFLPGELIAEPGELWRGSRITPVFRKIVNIYASRAQTFGNLCNGQDKIVWRVVLIYVDEVFQHGKRLVL